MNSYLNYKELSNLNSQSISENIILTYKKNLNNEKVNILNYNEENNNHRDMSDSVRIYNYITNELVIVKSEMKIEKSDNTNLNADNVSVLSVKNEETSELYDMCYILHDPFVKRYTSAKSIKKENLENINGIRLFDTDLKSNHKSLEMKSAEYLHKISGNNTKSEKCLEMNSGDANKPNKHSDKKMQRSFSGANDLFLQEIVFNLNNAPFEGNTMEPRNIEQLEIIDLNEELVGTESPVEKSDSENRNWSAEIMSRTDRGAGRDLQARRVLAEIAENSKLLQNAEEVAMKCKDIPVSSSLSNSCKTKGKKERVFVLKRHRNIVENNNIDFSEIKLKDLINIEPFLPAPKSRRYHKSLKDCIKLNSKSQMFHLNKKFNKRSIEKYRIDLDGHIVMNEIDDKAMFPTINGMEEIVMNSDDIKSTARSFKRRKLSGKRWNSEEKENFYKALMVTGTDFTRMATIFPKRSRDDLKKKFKVEEKLNPNLIEQILRSRVYCDSSLLKLDSHLSKNPRKSLMKTCFKKG